MTTLYTVSIGNPHIPGEPLVELPSLRTIEEVDALRKKYKKVVATPAGRRSEPPIATEADTFREALQALIRCYRAASARGDQGLARRAELAVGELMGEQKHLKSDSGRPITLSGVGQ